MGMMGLPCLQIFGSAQSSWDGRVRNKWKQFFLELVWEGCDYIFQFQSAFWFWVFLKFFIIFGVRELSGGFTDAVFMVDDG